MEHKTSSKSEPPIYRQTAQYAMEHGERDAYFASRRAFEACGRAIDENVNRHFDGTYLSDGVVQDVLSNFSEERVTLVLACTVQHKEWDLRFSPRNREWAKAIDTSCLGEKPYYCMAEAHPAVLDGFISLFREQVLAKDKKAPAHEKPIKHARERSDVLEL